MIAMIICSSFIDDDAQGNWGGGICFAGCNTITDASICNSDSNCNGYLPPLLLRAKVCVRKNILIQIIRINLLVVDLLNKMIVIKLTVVHMMQMVKYQGVKMLILLMKFKRE